jgi:hypothetical protein
VDTAELLYVNTREKLQQAIAELRSQTVIGIDVEAHSFRWVDQPQLCQRSRYLKPLKEVFLS